LMDVEHERLVKQKLVNMARYVEEIAPYLQGPVGDYLASAGRRRIVERLAQVIVESAIDTNALLIEMAGGVPADTARRSFETIHRLGLIDDELLSRFRRTYVGLRNRIVHDYDVLDNKIVYYTARRLVDDARKYIEAIYASLDQLRNQRRGETDDEKGD